MVIRIVIEVYGDDLDLKTALSEINDDVIVFSANERGTLAPGGKAFPGSCFSILNPLKLSFGEGLRGYEAWYVTFLQKYYGDFRKHGASDFSLLYEVFYHGDQCNFEILDKHLIGKLSKFDISIPVSVYKVPRDEMYSLLMNAGYNETQIAEIT